MQSVNDGNGRWPATAGKVLAFLWAGWWTFFAVAVVISEGGNPMNILKLG